MILTLAMILTLTNGYHSKVVKAAVKTQCTTYNGNNIGAQDYTGKQSNYYPGPMKSYLVAQKDGTFYASAIWKSDRWSISRIL